MISSRSRYDHFETSSHVDKQNLFLYYNTLFGKKQVFQYKNRLLRLYQKAVCFKYAFLQISRFCPALLPE